MDKQPAAGDYPAYYKEYITSVPEGHITDILTQQVYETTKLVNHLSNQQGEFRYSPDKWTIKEVLGHMADTERVMAFRMFAFGRGDKADLPGFEEDDYVRNALFNKQTIAALIENLIAVRQATVHMLYSFDQKAWKRSGTANGSVVTVHALAYIIAGHELHHRRILKERYFSAEAMQKIQ